MPKFCVCVSRKLYQSTFLIVQATDEASAKAQVEAGLESGVLWDELKDNLEVEALGHWLTIDELDQAPRDDD